MHVVWGKSQMNKPQEKAREFWIFNHPNFGWEVYTSEPQLFTHHLREVLPIPQSVEAEIEQHGLYLELTGWGKGYVPSGKQAFKDGYELAMRTMKNE
jgi:hypothetical protein